MKRNPDIHRPSRLDAEKPRRAYSDDREWDTVYGKCFPDHSRIAAEPLFPIDVTDYRCRTCSEAVVVHRKETAQDGWNALVGEYSARHEFLISAFRQYYVAD